MISIFRRQPAKVIPFHTDFGVRLFPESPDGPVTLSASIAMLKQMEAAGVVRCIAAVTVGGSNPTAHTSAALPEWMAVLRSAAAKASITMQLDVAGRYFLDPQFESLLASGALLPLPGNRLLLDNSPGFTGHQLHARIFQIEMAGYKPMLGRVEHYSCFCKNKESLFLLRRCKCDLQVELLSLLGYHGFRIKWWSRYLVRNGYAKYVASGIRSETEARFVARHLRSGACNRWLEKARPLA